MHNGLFGAFQGFEAALYQFAAGLCQHLDSDIIGHLVFLDQPAHEIEIRL